jgi:hypothetical protein
MKKRTKRILKGAAILGGGAALAGGGYAAYKRQPAPSKSYGSTRADSPEIAKAKTIYMPSTGVVKVRNKNRKAKTTGAAKAYAKTPYSKLRKDIFRASTRSSQIPLREQKVISRRIGLRRRFNYK